MKCNRVKYYGRFLKSIFNLNVRLMWGMWKLTRLPQPAITVFGGASVKTGSSHAVKATALTKLLVDAGFSIITGGGPGIMEAANQGALEYLRECNLKTPGACRPIVSGGIGLIKLEKEKLNPYVQTIIIMEHFFSRKWLLVRYATAFVVFPGGLGTLDELFEILTLAQTKHMPQHPIILIDREYWEPFVAWLENRALRDGLIKPQDRELFVVLDDVYEAAMLIKKRCCAESQPLGDCDQVKR